MTAAVRQNDCPIVARGLGAGALWGGLIGVAVLFGGSVLSGEMTAMVALPFAVIIGAVVGGLLGLISGVVLALREQRGGRTDRDRRLVAVVVSVLTWTVVGVVGRSATLGGTLLLLGLATVGGIAGALLAPRVVRGHGGPGAAA